MEENNHTFLIKIVKSIIYTFAVIVVFMAGLYSLVSRAFTNMSAEQSNAWAIICICIGIIYTVFYCTFTILDEIRKKN